MKFQFRWSIYKETAINRICICRSFNQDRSTRDKAGKYRQQNTGLQMGNRLTEQWCVINRLLLWLCASSAESAKASRHISFIFQLQMPHSPSPGQQRGPQGQPQTVQPPNVISAVLCAACYTLSATCWVLCPVRRATHWMLCTECYMLCATHWVLHAEWFELSGMPSTHWVVCATSYTLSALCRVLHVASNILSSTHWVVCPASYTLCPTCCVLYTERYMLSVTRCGLRTECYALASYALSATCRYPPPLKMTMFMPAHGRPAGNFLGVISVRVIHQNEA